MSAVRDFRSKTFAALQVRNFRLYFFGQLVSVSGTWMQSVAQGWLILQLTDSAVDLGTSIALQYLPMLFFASYGGLVADRLPKRRILYVTQASAGVLAVILGLMVTTHHATVIAVYALSFLLGVVNLFDMPARQAFVQQMVGKELIANAVSLNSVLMNAGRLVGPAISAGVIALFGTASCFYVNAASYAAVILALWLMNEEDFTPMRNVVRSKGQLRLGLRYAWGTPLIRRVLVAVALVGTFAFNFTTTLPLLSRHSFHEHSAGAYSVLLSAMGLGAVIGGLYIAHRSRPNMGLLTTEGILFGLSMMGVAFSPNVACAAIFLVCTGAFSISFVSTANAILQLNSAEQMRGRVMSLHGTAFLGSTPIGAPLIGWIISQSNARVGIFVGAMVALGTGLMLLRALAKERQHGATPASN
ncbi:MAG: MFS transporter [Actinomycetota bacterium]